MELVDYGEFGEYTREMQQVFPSSRGFEVSVSKTSTRHPRRSDLPSNPVRRPANWSARPGRATPKGTEYDMVRDKVLEDTGEKTVIISTWRERVAEETKKEDMSVYYLSPRDYEFQEEAFRARQEAQRDVDSSEGMSVDDQGSPWSLAGIEVGARFSRALSQGLIPLSAVGTLVFSLDLDAIQWRACAHRRTAGPLIRRRHRER